MHKHCKHKSLKQIKEIIDKNNALVFMSGTLHSKEIIKNIFGIKDFAIVYAETLNYGTIEIIRTGKEFDCSYSSLSGNEHSREDYLFSMSECVKKAKPPILIHVNSFKDLPNEAELERLNSKNLISLEKLTQTQKEDKTGEQIIKFKKGIIDKLFTTKCSRGIDFPKQMCNSIIFTKYPNPNINDTFWKILKKTHPSYFWEFYQDKAHREFLQRIYRAVRSKEDHIYILSPDMRVIEAIRKIQLNNLKKV